MDKDIDEFESEAVHLILDSRHGCFAVDRDGRSYFHPFLHWFVHFSKKPRWLYLVDADIRRRLETEERSTRYLLYGIAILVILFAYGQDVAFLKSWFPFYFLPLYYGVMKIMLRKHLDPLRCVEGVISPTAAQEKTNRDINMAVVRITINAVVGIFAWLYVSNFPSWLSMSVFLIWAGWFLRFCYRLGRISAS